MSIESPSRDSLHVLTANYPALTEITSALLSVWPEHEAFLRKSFTGRSENESVDTEQAAKLIVQIAQTHGDSLTKIAADYQFFCQKMILEEEIFFRRNKRYRLSTFEDAFREVYSNDAIMVRYMNGLLLSSIFWLNHAQALSYYIRTYLPGNPQGFSHLEVGPGHGTLLYFAIKEARSGAVTGWDVSPGAVRATGQTLDAFGLGGDVTLECRDVFEASKLGHEFDSIVISEVLEHLEDPKHALENLRACLRPNGRIWVNFPVNSPSPDHLYLLRQPEEVAGLVESAGIEILEQRDFPMTGYTIEKARKLDLTINCVVIGRRVD